MSLHVYFDEDFASTAHAGTLKRYGHDVLRPHDVGLLAHSDEEHLSFAASVERMLVSYNRKDYMRIHAEWMAMERRHSGILLVNKFDPYSPESCYEGSGRLSASSVIPERETRSSSSRTSVSVPSRGWPELLSDGASPKALV